MIKNNVLSIILKIVYKKFAFLLKKITFAKNIK